MTERDKDTHDQQSESYDKKNDQRGCRHKVAFPCSTQVSVCRNHFFRQIERL